jgi:hypothetical protein
MPITKTQPRPVAKRRKTKKTLPLAVGNVIVQVGKKRLRFSPDDAVGKKMITADLIMNLVSGYTTVAKRALKIGRSQKFTLEVSPEGTFVEAPLTAPDDALETALAAARERGQVKIAEILAGKDMLRATEFGGLIGVSYETVNQRRKAGEVLGLQGAKRALRYPRWQLTEDGRPLPGLSRLFEVLGDQPWTVYRFLKTSHAELGGETAVEAMKAGKLDAVLGVARNQVNGVFS